jgi:hypothetical protein
MPIKNNRESSIGLEQDGRARKLGLGFSCLKVIDNILSSLLNEINFRVFNIAYVNYLYR